MEKCIKVIVKISSVWVMFTIAINIWCILCDIPSLGIVYRFVNAHFPGNIVLWSPLINVADMLILGCGGLGNPNVRRTRLLKFAFWGNVACLINAALSFMFHA